MIMPPGSSPPPHGGYCGNCGSSLPYAATYCGNCGSFVLRTRAAIPKKRYSIWVLRLLGLAVIGGIGFGAWYYYSGRLDGGNSWASRTADIVNSGVRDTDQIDKEMQTQLTKCEAGNMSACDAMFASLQDTANRLDALQLQLSRQGPPPEAAKWRDDYIRLLADKSSYMNRLVQAWNREDFNAFDQILQETQGLDARESYLVDYFNNNLR